MKTRYILLIVLLVCVGVAGYFLGNLGQSQTSLPTPSFINPRTFDKYTILNLANAKIEGSQIALGEKLSETSLYTSYLFSFRVDADLDGRAPKSVTGLINIPAGNGPFPLIVMFRGYVDQKTYATGAGSKRAGEFFAQNGFITIAPDFLGYAASDKEAENIFESRFQTYVTALSLIQSLGSISSWDQENIFIWGHSNGGQIALTFLEITQENFPTALWAPVSKPFPYSILYYTDDSDDRGKLIRSELAKFEDTYDVELYSITNYFDRIKSPIQLHQGTSDTSVPKAWSDELANQLKKLDLDFDYQLYPGADHNLNPSWNTAVSNSLEFFQKHLRQS